MSTCKQIVLAVTGASGACYARRFLERAAALEGVAVHVILTDTLVDSFVARILQIAGLAPLEADYQWKSKE